MIRGRSAMLMLMACVLQVAPSRGSHFKNLLAKPVHSLIAVRSATSIGWPDSHRASRGATLSQFNPWKTRVKIVLVETKPRVNEECDLGPAILAGQNFDAGTFELVSCPLSTRLPLRC
jgi:hypothetical protein